ncbi:YdeI/OmpD-associated family protein [Sphingopyxis witflariensis]|nr:YdeI/OmpD-associated family protein [Sphingopyxis witflariensis]
MVLEAKREETRVKRIETIAAQVAEGKDRNWKYKSC